MVLRDDVLIENNNYSCVIMQNNGAMKVVNFAHAQTAETKRSFLRPRTSGTRLLRLEHLASGAMYGVATPGQLRFCAHSAFEHVASLCQLASEPMWLGVL